MQLAVILLALHRIIFITQKTLFKIDIILNGSPTIYFIIHLITNYNAQYQSD